MATKNGGDNIVADKEPTINRYVLKINNLGDVIDTIDLKQITTQEKNEVLSIVFTQGLKRLGYERDIKPK